MHLHIERLTGPNAHDTVEPLLREYVTWAAHTLTTATGFRFDDIEADIEAHHAVFEAEVPNLVGRRGRLLVARWHEKPVGVGALKPIDAGIAELKRVYVRPWARGSGAGRALVHHLVDSARSERYRTVRLETATFMTAAHALYESMGFRDVPPFEGSESNVSGFGAHTRYMELPLGHG